MLEEEVVLVGKGVYVGVVKGEGCIGNVVVVECCCEIWVCDCVE